MIDVAPDIPRIFADQSRRIRSKEKIGARDTMSTFQIPISGQAGSAIVYVETETLKFDVAYRPTVGSSRGLKPSFTFGFELTDAFNAGDAREVGDIPGLIGSAKVKVWERNPDGYFTGVVVHIGVVNMSGGVSKDTPPVPFEGTCFLNIVGRATMLPLSFDETEQ